ncbi:MAG: YkgJ family cysteine cluster protein [Alphaproteobacteria bacterium]|nr:YkgJ family cysteine cluster protein [Alphaproteobacteria bacterium]
MSSAPSGGDAGNGSVSANLTLKIGNNEIQARLTVPAAPIKPQAVLPALQALVNAVVDAAERDLQGTGRTVSCKAGCGACCRQAVPIAVVEAYHIRDLVEALPEPRRSTVKQRYADASRRLKASGLYDTLMNASGLSLQQRQRLGLDYFALGIACPFLEDESCSIHLDRPLSCREYLVTSPAERCATPEIGVDPLKVPMLSHSLQRIGTNDDRYWIPLSLALDWVAAHPDTLPMRSGPDWVQDILSRIGRPPPSEPDAPEPQPDASATAAAPDEQTHKLSLPMPVGDVAAIDMLPAFRTYTDAMVDGAIEYAAAQGQATSCREGCAACCRQFVVISTTEARRIAALVEAMPEPRRSQVRARFEHADRRIADWSATLGHGPGGPQGKWTNQELAASYVGLWLDCPLLENERCSIYEERPLVCREYLVTSPAELCARLNEPGVQVKPIPRLFTSRALDHLLSDETPPAPSRIALAQALRWVARNPQETSVLRTADDWLHRFLSRVQEAGELDHDPAPQPVDTGAPQAVPPPAMSELKVDVPAEPVAARAVLPALRAVADAAVQHAVALVEAQGRRISCKAGCGACCDQLVPIGPVEAHMIADLVATLPEPRRSTVRARFAAAEARLAAWPHRPDLENVDRLKGEAKYQMSLDYFRLGIACPFLEHGSCSIYEERPLVCREYLVTSPADHCSRQGDPTAPISMVLVTQTNHALALLPHDDPADLIRLPLTLALSWSAAHPETPDRRPGRVWMERFVDRLRLLEESAQAQANRAAGEAS